MLEQFSRAVIRAKHPVAFKIKFSPLMNQIAWHAWDNKGIDSAHRRSLSGRLHDNIYVPALPHSRFASHI